MRKLIVAAVLFAFASLGCATLSHAQEASIFSLSRLSVAAGAGYAWYYETAEEPAPTFGKEWVAGVYASYSLLGPPSPTTALTYSAEYGMDNRLITHRLGLRAVIFRGTP